MSIELRRARRNQLARRRVMRGRRGRYGATHFDVERDGESILAAVEALPTGWGQAPEGWLLEALGFYGLDAVEEGILIALVTGEPILLVGRHGTAKTAICCRLGEVLGLTFHAYDAAKALFEDVVGFPDPSSLARGEVSYVPTPMSLWDKEFVLVDELSRAQPQMQNKWLEVIRSHRLMGRPLPNLRYVIAAMNPTDYLGAVPLDEALLSRFAVVVKMPEVAEMNEDVALRVIAARSADDAPLVGEALSGAPGNGDVVARARRRLRRRLAAARRQLTVVEALLGEAVLRYVHEVAMHLTERGHGMDARRLGMVRRNLLVALALSVGERVVGERAGGSRAVGERAVMEGAVRERALGEGEEDMGASPEQAFRTLGASREEVSSLVGRTLSLSLPFAADARPGPSAQMLGMIHREAFDQTFLGSDERGVAGEEEGAGPGTRMPRRAGRHQLVAYRHAIDDLPMEEHYRVANDFLQRAQEALPERLVAAWDGLLALGELVREHASAVPWEVTEHLMDGLAVRLGIAEASSTALVTLCSAEELDPQRPLPARRARQCLAHASLRQHGDHEDAARLWRLLRDQGDIS